MDVQYRVSENSTSVSSLMMNSNCTTSDVNQFYKGNSVVHCDPCSNCVVDTAVNSDKDNEISLQKSGLKHSSASFETLNQSHCVSDSNSESKLEMNEYSRRADSQLVDNVIYVNKSDNVDYCNSNAISKLNSKGMNVNADESGLSNDTTQCASIQMNMRQLHCADKMDLSVNESCIDTDFKTCNEKSGYEDYKKAVNEAIQMNNEVRLIKSSFSELYGNLVLNCEHSELSELNQNAILFGEIV